MSLISLHDTTKVQMGNTFAEKTIANLNPDRPFRKGLEYTPPARGAWTIAHTPLMVPDSITIFVCPQGCLRGVVLSAAELGPVQPDGLDRYAQVTVKEKNIFDGRMEQLFIKGISDILDARTVKPRVVFVFSACIHHFLSTDLELIHTELEKRYPEIQFIPTSMNCIMRNSKTNYEEINNRQIYRALTPTTDHNNRQINIIGNYFPLQRDSEMMEMLATAGYDILDLPLCKTFADYAKMAESSLNIYTAPLGHEAVRDMKKRLGQPYIYAPYSWDYDDIRTTIQRVSETTGAPLPDLDALEQETDEVLCSVREIIGDSPIHIDFSATVRPFQLADLLTSHGFNVKCVYSDVVSPEERTSFTHLQQTHPGLSVRSIVNFRSRTAPRDEAREVEKAGQRLIAIGQKAAYFTGTNHFVNIIFNRGLHGFKGIQYLARKISEAYNEPKDMKKLIQIKAWGCKA